MTSPSAPPCVKWASSGIISLNSLILPQCACVSDLDVDSDVTVSLRDMVDGQYWLLFCVHVTYLSPIFLKNRNNFSPNMQFYFLAHCCWMCLVEKKKVKWTNNCRFYGMSGTCRSGKSAVLPARCLSLGFPSPPPRPSSPRFVADLADGGLVAACILQASASMWQNWLVNQ